MTIRLKWNDLKLIYDAHIRPAAEAMLAKAEDIAAGRAEYETFLDWN